LPQKREETCSNAVRAVEVILSATYAACEGIAKAAVRVSTRTTQEMVAV